jgi:protein-disulfide isomerase
MYEEKPNEHPVINVPPTTVVVVPKAEKSVFDAIPAKVAFFSGLAAGIMVFATIGFILMLISGMDFSKFNLAGGKGTGFGVKNPVVANANDNANTNAPAAAGIDKMPGITAADHVRGDLSKAKVALVEYSDYECPYCKQFQSTMQQVAKTYGADVAWVYRYFPLSFHQNAEKEAEAAECVAQIGGNTAFWNFSDKIYERTTSNGTGFALTALGPLAKEVGVDQKKFQTCLDSGKNAKLVADEQAGGEAAGISGTPGTFIITKEGKTDEINGAQSFATVKGQIDALLK